MPVLATTLFGPKFAFSERFEQRNWSSPLFFVWHTFLDELFQMVACFNTVKQRSPKSGPRARSGLRRSPIRPASFLRNV